MYLPSSLDRQHAVNSCQVDTFCMTSNSALCIVEHQNLAHPPLFSLLTRCNVHKSMRIIPLGNDCMPKLITISLKVHCTWTPVMSVSIFCVIVSVPCAKRTSFESHWIIRVKTANSKVYKTCSLVVHHSPIFPLTSGQNAIHFTGMPIFPALLKRSSISNNVFYCLVVVYLYLLFW